MCDINPESLEPWRDNADVRCYDDYQQVLSDASIDAVCLATPVPLHARQAIAALDAGKHVLSEVTAAYTIAEAWDLVKAVERTGLTYMMAENYCYMRENMMVENMVAQGVFGEISMVKTKFTQGPYRQLWGIDSAKRSFLIGQICHICDLARYFGGDVQTVSAMYHEVTPTQFSYIANVKYTSGAVGIFDWNTLAAKNFRDIDEELEVVGLETHLICRDMLTLDWQPRQDWTDAAPHAGRYFHSFKPGWVGTRFTDRTYGYTGEVAHFALKCIGQAEGGPDLWDSYHALKIGEAVYESAHSGQAVTIESYDAVTEASMVLS